MTDEVELPKVSAEDDSPKIAEPSDNIADELSLNTGTAETNEEDEEVEKSETFEDLQKIYEDEETKPPSNLREKILITLEKPSYSKLAFGIAAVIMFFIILSTITFLIGTLPEYLEVIAELTYSSRNLRL